MLVVGANEAIRGALLSAPFVWWEMSFQDRERGRVECGEAWHAVIHGVAKSRTRLSA